MIECLKQLNQKVLVTFQGADIQIEQNINYGFRLDKKYENNLKKNLKNIDHFFFISRTIKNDLLDLKIPESKMSYFPNSVEIAKFKKFNIPKKKSNKLNLITVARYAPQKKGYDILLKVGEKLIEKKIDFEWKIVGDGTNQLLSNEIMKKYKENFKIFQNIENLNEEYFPHSKLVELYKSSDVYINLSRIESFGITFIEALASSIPVLTFDTKGANEIIKDNINGYLVKNDDDLINKILQISNNRKTIDNLKNNLLSTILDYDLNLVTEKYNAIE